MTEAALIELVDVDATPEDDPERAVVREVRWSIGAGEWWAVCGGASTGKSALLAAAAGLAPPARGVVRIFGIDRATAEEKDRTEWRRRIGFVFENGGRLLGRLSVAENVALPFGYHDGLDADEARQRALALLAEAGLEALADAAPGRLSPAMQQRVALLRALASPLRVLFLDEPLRGLAARDAQWWLRFLRDLRARRSAQGAPLAIVASGYDFSVWRADADHFAWIEEERFRVLPARPEEAA